VSYRQQAAEKALQRFAYPEAATHLQQGLALLETLPETTARRQQTLTMLLALGSALQSTVGQGHPDVAHVYDRALALCQPLEHTLQHFRLLAGLRRFYLGRGQVRVSCKLGEQLLAMAEHLQKPELLAEAHYALGITCLWSGELARASAYLEQGVIPDMALRPSPSSFFSGLHPSVAGRIHMAQPLWLLGYADQALRQSLETLTMTRQLAHAHSTTVALSVCAKMHLWRGEFQAGQEHARATIAIAQEQGFTHFLTIGLFYRGWALAAQGQAEGLMYMRQGIDANHATSSGPLQPFFLALLAEAYGQQGQAHTGLQLLAEAVKLVEHTEARWIEAELYRLRGTLLLIGRNNPACRSPHCNSQPMEAEAERAFQRARAIAHDQGARALELRAVTHLSRLWQQQGKPDAARQLLTEVYGWFTEGFDTMDLREARTLLRALDGARPRVSEPCVASTRSATAGAVRQRA
jgi:adenylate cyclase